jgi:hypothetical protein
MKDGGADDRAGSSARQVTETDHLPHQTDTGFQRYSLCLRPAP